MSERGDSHRIKQTWPSCARAQSAPAPPPAQYSEWSADRARNPCTKSGARTIPCRGAGILFASDTRAGCLARVYSAAFDSDPNLEPRELIGMARKSGCLPELL